MKSSLITGVSSGIGHQCVKKFLETGVTVVGGCRRQVKCESGKGGAQLIWHYLDLENTESISGFCENVKSTISQNSSTFSYLVLNAGCILQPADWLTQTDVDVEKTMKINFSGNLYLVKALHKLGLLECLESIVLVGSVYGRRGAAPVLAYCSAKAALESMAMSLARELAPRTRVNCVLPGHINTKMMAPADDPFTKQVVSRTPLGRIGEPIEVVEAIEFLSFSASFVTGSSIVVDGGFTLS